MLSLYYQAWFYPVHYPSVLFPDNYFTLYANPYWLYYCVECLK